MAIRLNSDKAVVKKIRDGLRANDGYCPCRIGKKDEFKCMCSEFKKQIADPDFVIVCFIIKQRIDKGALLCH